MSIRLSKQAIEAFSYSLKTKKFSTRSYTRDKFIEFVKNSPIPLTLALKLKVQLFITTQSLEAIEAILKFGNYETNQDNDPIKIITLRKIYVNIYSNKTWVDHQWIQSQLKKKF